MSSAVVSDRQLRLVIVASTLGTIIEWYDFYIFGSLATILSAHFFRRTRWRLSSRRWPSSPSDS
ncbi:MAG TPA: hypothetical protein VIK99_03675 [Thermaerobacter sp.]